MRDDDQIIRNCQEHLALVEPVLVRRDMALARMYLNGQGSHRVLGLRYGLSESTVRNAVHRYQEQILAERATTDTLAG